jgi:hypothetical protein
MGLKRRNALSLELMLDLLACLDEVDGNDAIRAGIVASTGSVFSSGHDLPEMTGRQPADYMRRFDVCTELMMRIQSIRQPVIAEVQGSQPRRDVNRLLPAIWPLLRRTPPLPLQAFGSLHNADGCAQPCNRSQASARNASDRGDDQRGDSGGLGVD